LEESPLRNDEEESRQKRLLLKLRMNRAHCLIKLCWPKKACIELQKTIDMDEKNVKALYRMGKSKRMIGKCGMEIVLKQRYVQVTNCVAGVWSQNDDSTPYRNEEKDR
jgi:hypothetical protein